MSSDFEPHQPDKNVILTFKVGSKSRLEQMRKGLIYRNSLNYFSSIEENTSTSLRHDPLEKAYSRATAGDSEKGYSKLMISVGDTGKNNAIDLGENAVLTMEYGEPDNIMIFCMSAFYFSNDGNGEISGEINGALPLDKCFLEFGSHILVIRNISEFSNRLNDAISSNSNVYWSEYLHEMYGLVEYKDLKRYSGHIGLFRKDLEYKWQREFRICFGVHNKGLNKEGAFELNIGDLSDITEIISVQAMLDKPLTFKRTLVKKVGDKYIKVTQ